MPGSACHTELTPLAFLRRSAEVYPDKTAISYGTRRYSYAEFADQVSQVARALRAAGIQPGDRVAYLLPNLPEMLIAHFAVPLAGAVLVAINTRLSSEEVRHILDHSGAKLLVVDSVLAATVAPVAAELRTVTEIVTLTDPAAPGSGADPAGPSYAEFVGQCGAEASARPWTVDDERSTISINYTSGTTGRPKGVMYTHRGAYLNSLSEIVHSAHTPDSVYLWTLPMFHCNGWCTPWAVTAIGGTHVCLREVRGDVIWRLIGEHGVTHLNGAPTVVTAIMNAPEAVTLDYQLVVTTAVKLPSAVGFVENVTGM